MDCPKQIGKPCFNFQCSHNFYHKERCKPVLTPKSIQYENCFCKLDGKCFTMQEVADIYSVSRQRVEQIEKQALKHFIQNRKIIYGY